MTPAEAIEFRMMRQAIAELEERIQVLECEARILKAFIPRRYLPVAESEVRGIAKYALSRSGRSR